MEQGAAPNRNCIEFRHGHSLEFLWWIESVFFEGLAKHFNGRMFDEGIGFYDRDPEPEKITTYKDYILRSRKDISDDKSRIGDFKRWKILKWNKQFLKGLPKEVINDLNLNL